MMENFAIPPVTRTLFVTNFAEQFYFFWLKAWWTSISKTVHYTKFCWSLSCVTPADVSLWYILANLGESFKLAPRESFSLLSRCQQLSRTQVTSCHAFLSGPVALAAPLPGPSPTHQLGTAVGYRVSCTRFELRSSVKNKWAEGYLEVLLYTTAVMLTSITHDWQLLFFPFYCKPNLFLVYFFLFVENSELTD